MRLFLKLFKCIDYKTINHITVQYNIPQKQNSADEEDISHIPDIETIDTTEYLNNMNLIQKIFSLLLNKIGLIWIIVALILFVRKITIYQSFIKYINARLTFVDDTELLDSFFIIAEQLDIKKPIELCTNPLVSSPLLIGFFHPYIVLPYTNISEKDFSYIILHELIHYKQRDMFYKWLVQITICLHWFNPFVYLMGKEINKACEFSCDETVITKVGFSKAQEYGKTLLDAMMAVGKYKESFGYVTLSENKQLLKERLGAIMNFRKKSKLATIVLTLCVIFGTSFIGIYPINASSIGNSYRYTQEGYYQSPYIFEIGWNVWEKHHTYYTTKVLTLNTGEQLTVYFSDDCETSINDNETIKALISLLTDIYNKTKDSDFPMLHPLIISISYVGNTNITDIAEQCYNEGNLVQFGAAFSRLNETKQQEFLNRIYNEDKIAFFSVSLNKISSDSPLIEHFAKKAYSDGKIAFFSILTDYMNDETLKSWLVKTKSDKQINFQSVLLKAIGNEIELENMKAELDQQIIDEYKAYDIIKDGKSYYYKNQLVNVFLDIRKDSSFYVLDMNPLGRINIKITRDETGKIQSIDYMNEDEISQLFGEDI